MRVGSLLFLLALPSCFVDACSDDAPRRKKRVRTSRANARYPRPPVLPEAPERIRIASDDEDGTEIDGTWDRDVARVAPGSLVALRFRLDEPLEEAPVYARLLLPALPAESHGTHLRITALADDGDQPFSERLPSEGARTSAVVEWRVTEPCDPYRDDHEQRADLRCAPFERASPDLTPLLAELAPDHPEQITLLLEPVDGTFVFQDRLDVRDVECPGYVSAHLELFPTLRSALVAKELLARPTDREATVTAEALVDLEARVVFTAGGGERSTEPVTVAAGEPIHQQLTGLPPDSDVAYSLHVRRPGTETWDVGPTHTFHTARPAGQAFTFTVTSDGHLVNMQNRRAYSHMTLLKRTMEEIAREAPDFHLDLGDTFNGESYRSYDALDEEELRKRMLDVRPYFELVGGSAPVFLALGNHEGEQGWRIAAGDPLPDLSLRLRSELFPGPLANDFYLASPEPTQNYYAFQWGDALIVVLDPYRYTMRKPHDLGGSDGSDDRWDWTLGQEQHAWLKRTLEGSDARFKLVFSHQVVGGANDYGRGGRPYPGEGSFEWGGTDPDGSWTFDERRPGWPAPIHGLLADTDTTAFFHGHDHLFVFEEPLDGVSYVTVPQPGDASSHIGHGKRSGYPESAVQLSSSGYLALRVEPGEATLEYVQVRLPSDEGPEREVVFSHTFR